MTEEAVGVPTSEFLCLTEGEEEEDGFQKTANGAKVTASTSCTWRVFSKVLGIPPREHAQCCERGSVRSLHWLILKVNRFIVFVQCFVCGVGWVEVTNIAQTIQGSSFIDRCSTDTLPPCSSEMCCMCVVCGARSDVRQISPLMLEFVVCTDE